MPVYGIIRGKDGETGERGETGWNERQIQREREREERRNERRGGREVGGRVGMYGQAAARVVVVPRPGVK